MNNSLVKGGAGAGVGARIGVGARKTAEEGVGVLLPLVKTPGGSPTSLFLLPGGGLGQGLWQMRGLTIA